MNLLETIIIAVVEGLTEFLPISSTGHMIIAQALLGVESSDFVKAFTVNIQFGAILSVVVLYWKRFFKLNPLPLCTDELHLQGGRRKLLRWTSQLIHRFDFYWKLFIAFIPAAIIGFLCSDYIDALLENVFVVALMLLLGGLLMLFVDRYFDRPAENQEMTWQRAVRIGLFQCIAMIPGFSRSMATIVGGMTARLSRKNAAEFSFFLAVPTMAAAAGYKLMKLLTDSVGVTLLKENLQTLLLGNIVAFLVAMAAIKFFIGFLSKYGFKAFGYYRILVGSVLLLMMALGIELSI